MTKLNTKFNDFLDKQSFEYIFELISKYIKQTLESDVQINEYVPNTHIAETFKDVLVACEMENMYKDVYHNVKMDGLNFVNPDRIHLYNYIDGMYYLKTTNRISFLDNIDDYFNLERLKQNGNVEIHRVYQKLRERDDIIRNNLKLIDTRIPFEYNMEHKIKMDLKSHKIKIK